MAITDRSTFNLITEDQTMALSQVADRRSRESRERYESIRARIRPIHVPTDEELLNMPTPPLAPYPFSYLK